MPREACEMVSSASAIKPRAAFYIPPFRGIVYFTAHLFLMKKPFPSLLTPFFAVPQTKLKQV